MASSPVLQYDQYYTNATTLIVDADPIAIDAFVSSFAAESATSATTSTRDQYHSQEVKMILLALASSWWMVLVKQASVWLPPLHGSKEFNREQKSQREHHHVMCFLSRPLFLEYAFSIQSRSGTVALRDDLAV